MLTFPIRLTAFFFVVLFCNSRLVRRAVAAVVVSAILVAAQNGDILQAFADQPGHGAILKALSALAGG